MNLKVVFISFVASLLMTSTALASGGSHWAYDGHEGPEHWSELNHDYVMCKDGKKQSPINLTQTNETKLSKINFRYVAEAKEIFK